MARTQQRDLEATVGLEAAGWKVLRMWDFEVESDVAACVGRVVQAVAERKPARLNALEA